MKATFISKVIRFYRRGDFLFGFSSPILSPFSRSAQLLNPGGVLAAAGTYNSRCKLNPELSWPSTCTTRSTTHLTAESDLN